MTTGEPTQDTPATPPAGPRNTHFDFQAKVFQAPGAHFELRGHPKVVTFAVDMGAGQGFISLKDLRRTFFIEAGGHDDKLIDKAEAGLHYVPDIRPGDEIPNEILDGTASWTVARKHKQIARDRLQVQLLSWMTGKPIVYANQDELKKIIAEDTNKKALKEAFTKAAVALGIDPSQSEKVLDRIETLAREICYIEALRDRSKELLRIRANVESLIKVYSADLRASADLGRIKMLMVKAVAETDDIFNNIDAETADVLGALMSIEFIIKSVRKARDDLHYILMEWDPVIAKWQNLEMVRSQEVDKALSVTYQFLAKRFSTGKSIMKARPKNNPAAAEAPKSMLRAEKPGAAEAEAPKSLLKAEQAKGASEAPKSLLKADQARATPIEAPKSLLKGAPEKSRAKTDPGLKSLLNIETAKPSAKDE